MAVIIVSEKEAGRREDGTTPEATNHKLAELDIYFSGQTDNIQLPTILIILDTPFLCGNNQASQIPYETLQASRH